MQASRFFTNAPRKIALAMVTIVTVISSLHTPALADITCPKNMSKLDCEAIINGWSDWVPDLCGDTGSSGPSAHVGNDNMEKALRLLTSNGLTVNQSAAIVGNLMGESGQALNPTATNSIGAYGIAQWLGGRLTELKKLPNYTTFDVQLDYLWNTDIPAQEKQYHGLQKIKADKTLEDMVFDWEDSFERAGDVKGDDDIIRRTHYANDAVAYAAKLGITDGSDSSGGGPSSDCGGGSAGPNISCNGTSLPSGTGQFSTNTSLPPYQDVNKMIARACQLADDSAHNHSDAFFMQWLRLGPPSGCTVNQIGSCNAGWCMFTSGYLWGYANAGWNNPLELWNNVKQHTDRNPPVGALLIYDSTFNGSHTGDVVVYLGNNLITATDQTSDGVEHDGSFSIESADRREGRMLPDGTRDKKYTSWGLKYLGWTDPIFKGSTLK